ncbi:cytochrome P450 [Saccharopolyspora erythraea NRRL 2338]|uniref:Cytochrome P450 n=2 Tax=Saccharopolyspora erythraea TaxID=1836 RepID=A4FIF6_SACEN|nr:cytochrome P450 [Saccharopolyspora erythraea D]QRK87680.1 cytochrome P450 [Saccharopolyspora erythraea]CAM03831.1 cytochrome P450 [Saccharopolyspora erythraea NRRL 2338]
MEELQVDATRVGAGCPISRIAEEFDPFGEAYQQDPAGVLKAAREREPVFYSPELDHWVVTRYADIKEIFRDTRRFSASNALDPITPLGAKARERLAEYDFAPGPVLVNEDEPLHMRRRRALAGPLAADEVAKLEGRIRDLVTRYVDGFAGRGRADLVDDLLWEVPAIVGLLVCGVPDEDIDRARHYTIKMGSFTWGRPTEEHQVEIADQVGQWWSLSGRLVERLKREGGEGWVPTAIEVHREDPELVNDNHLQNMMMSGLVAAHETTTNATANALRHLLSNRSSWEALCADPSAIPNAVEECLRFSSSVLCWRRKALVDVPVGGVTIPAGARVLLVIGSGNHDDDVFGDPGELDIARSNAKRHLTFGIGSHACIGAPLARLEMRIILEELTRRLPGMRLVEGQDFGYLRNASFHGPRHLLVEWEPAGA